MTKERHYPSGSLRGAPKGISLFKKIFIFIYLYIWLGFPGGLISKESACNAGDLGSIPGLGRSPGKGKGYPLQYSGLKNFMDCIVHAHRVGHD